MNSLNLNPDTAVPSMPQALANEAVVKSEPDSAQKPSASSEQVPSQDVGMDRGGQHQPIAEFLYQLTKMLTDDNSEIIEWSDGRIKVHHPDRLETEVLHKYFRHSKFASFQRQLNYFGFRKIAGKGKMSPCSYVNEAATSDIRSLLLIKRKTNGSAARKAAMAQRAMALSAAGVPIDLQANVNLTAQLGALAGGVQPGGFLGGGQDFTSAAALLSQNALRVGLAQLQQMQQKAALGHNLGFPSNDNALSLLVQGQKKQNQAPAPGVATSADTKQDSASLEQLHAQLAGMASRQQNPVPNGLNAAALNMMANMAPASAALNFGGLAMNSGENSSTKAPAPAPTAGAPSSNPATAALNNATSALNASSSNPATEALNAANNPATAALNAATSSSTGSNNLFESSQNLTSLINERAGMAQRQAALAASMSQAALGGRVTSQGLMNRLPSSSAIFPDSTSTASLGNLLASSNRLSSLVSLSSFLSREPSMADFAMMGQNAQLAAAGLGVQNTQLHQAQLQNATADAAARLNNNSS